MFHDRRVSASHLALLEEAERRGIIDRINSGRRSMADQWRLVREKGIYHPTRNPDGAALPTPNAPHIWVGRENHAIDADAPQPVGKLAAFYRDMGVPVSFEVSTEAWHFRPPDEQALIHAAGSLRGIRGLLATLRPGMRHQDVRYARTLLRRHGALPKGPNRTPVYGVAMRAAAKRLQTSRGLTADAVIGPATWKALKAPPRPTAKPASPTPSPARRVRNGPDVSSFQGDVAWPRVGAACDFAIMKATEGLDFVDPAFTAERVRQARAALAPEPIGFYHFARPQKGRTGADEADHFVTTVRSRGGAKPGDMRLVLDLETTELDAKGTHAFAESFCDRIHELTGENAIVYTGPSFWNDKVGGKQAPRHGGALWVAHYTDASEPTVPRGWDRWVFWQFTSSGACPGIGGRVDMNRFAGTRSDLEAYRLG
jgi:GH25 family lysozyme M1 (1,4-beta-N-acetylmuramidase)